ncbi:MAG TPA: response regulator [Candidatus Limnocylindrales bacterium]|jgi:DNA-binding response OmpR family regulator|nr:response regulator [Candidatus Limnocylindrales bacterium]
MERGLQLLLVDDDTNDLVLFRTAVSKADLAITVRGEENGQHAIDYLNRLVDRRHWPDVIVLDLLMPRKDGFDFLTWHRTSQFASVPVVVFTGLGDQRERERGLASGASLVLEKPLRFRQLVEVVRTIASLPLTSV